MALSVKLKRVTMGVEQIIYALDLFGVAVFAISGALAAGKKRMDIFGVVVLGLVTSLGGGTLRDILLNSGPVFWIENRIYLLIGIIASGLTFVFVQRFSFSKRSLLFPDALGLAVFTLIGAAKTLSVTDSGSLAIVMGTMTGVAGGMIRDVLSVEVPLVLRKEVYATASLCGAMVYVFMIDMELPGIVCLISPIVTTLSIRLAAIYWGLSLPQLMADGDDSQ